MNSIQHLTDTKRVPWLRVLTVVTGLASLALMAPMLWLAAAGGVGLLVLGGLVLVGLAAVQALPLLGQKLENALLAARKAEARRNPIEQLQNEVMRRAERLKAFRCALVTVASQIENIRQLMQETRQRDRLHDLGKQERALARLQQFHNINLNRLSQAQAALEDFRSTVERKQSEWRIALAIGEANDMLDPNATENLMQDLLTDTALRSVQERFNHVFAELDVQMSSLDGPTRSLLDDSSLHRMDELHLPEPTHARNPS